jgi:hypothetical protein
MMTLEQATRVKESVEQEWLKIPGVTGIDAGYSTPAAAEHGEPVIRVYVANRQEALQRSAIPSEVQGVPVVLIERRFQLH